MNHRRGLDRHQSLLLPERLEDYVAANNPVRFLGNEPRYALDSPADKTLTCSLTRINSKNSPSEKEIT